MKKTKSKKTSKPKKKAAAKTAKAVKKSKPAKAPAKKPAAKPVKAAAKPAGKKRATKPAKKSNQKDPILPWRAPLPGEKYVGVVDDFYAQIGVITLNLEGALKVGDQIHVRGHTTDHVQTVGSMQVEHKSIQSAASGAGVGIKLDNVARKGDYVYRISEN